MLDAAHGMLKGAHHFVRKGDERPRGSGHRQEDKIRAQAESSAGAGKKSGNAEIS